MREEFIDTEILESLFLHSGYKFPTYPVSRIARRFHQSYGNVSLPQRDAEREPRQSPTRDGNGAFHFRCASRRYAPKNVVETLIFQSEIPSHWANSFSRNPARMLTGMS